MWSSLKDSFINKDGYVHGTYFANNSIAYYI